MSRVLEALGEAAGSQIEIGRRVESRSIGTECRARAALISELRFVLADAQFGPSGELDHMTSALLAALLSGTQEV